MSAWKHAVDVYRKIPISEAICSMCIRRANMGVFMSATPLRTQSDKLHYARPANPLFTLNQKFYEREF